MAYKNYPDSTPPIHPWEYSSGDYSSSSNHHINDNNMAVDAYSIDQGVGRELSSLLNFINAHHLGLSNKKIASGYFYQIGNSGQADWWNASDPIDYVWCKSGYIQNYHPVNATYSNIITSGVTFTISELLDGNPDLELWISGYINTKQNYYIDNYTANLDALSGTFFNINFVTGTGVIHQNYNKSSYEALHLEGKIKTNQIHIYSGIINSSGLYILGGTGIPGDVDSITYDPINGHDHTGINGSGTLITDYSIITSSGIWTNLQNKTIKNSTIVISGYNEDLNQDWSLLAASGYQSIIEFKDILFASYNDPTSGTTIIHRFNKTHGALPQIENIYNSGVIVTSKPEIIDGKLIYCGYDPNDSEKWQPKIYYTNNGDVWNYKNITIDEENSTPIINGQMIPEHITKFKNKYYMFGYQWNGIPKIIYADYLNSVWTSYDHFSVQDITMKLKNPVIYKNYLYFSDYVDNIYRIEDYDKKLEFILSTTSSGILTLSTGSETAAHGAQPAYFNNKMYRGNINNEHLFYYDNQIFNETTFDENIDHYSTAATVYKNTLFVQAVDNDVYRSTDGVNFTEDYTARSWRSMCEFKGELYAHDYAHDKYYKKSTVDGGWTEYADRFSSELGWMNIYKMITHNDKMYAITNVIATDPGVSFTLIKRLWESDDGDTWTPLVSGKIVDTIYWTGTGVIDTGAPGGPWYMTYTPSAAWDYTDIISYSGSIYINDWEDYIYYIVPVEGLLIEIIHHDSKVKKWNGSSLVDVYSGNLGFDYNLETLNDKLYFTYSGGGGLGYNSIGYVDPGDATGILTEAYAEDHQTFGITKFNNKLIYGDLSSGVIHVDNTIIPWKYYADSPAISSGNYINYKNKYIGNSVFYTNGSTSGVYNQDMQIKDAMMIKGQLYYNNLDNELIKLQNNEKVNIHTGTASDTINVKTIEVFNGKIYYINNNKALYYKNLEPKDKYSDIWSEEI